MDKEQVLIVEDMAITAMYIKNSLIKMGYSVTSIVSNYNDALNSIKQNTPDLILIDINLKGKKDGIELAEAIQSNNLIPFIYLTSDHSDGTIERAAKTNPSAYLSKPIRHEEIKSNVHIALKQSLPKNKIQDLGQGYTYDLVTKNIYRDDIPISLSPKERQLLDILVRSTNSLVPMNILEEHIWGSFVTGAENSLRNLVYRLKKKLPNLTIKTMKSIGYKLILNR
ncbi:MAG: DNA-binding response regulator [uncultured Sulfurovum sp.]|uniref:DNA-binding response regulator n=1 Tax=uncultured Sulfurovum sp. TaxID=269237 RepID=A0A6S6T3B6_9BACT|nr:MAG: DNA-binding response regulator [uncultured Sulfurovum sp.]